MNGERLYYLLIKTRTLAPKNRNSILNAVKNVMADTLKAVCLYQVFGETDMILRIWASGDDIVTINQKLRSHDDIRSVTVLLVKDMFTFYQEEMEKSPAWDWELPGRKISEITSHEFADEFQRDGKCLEMLGGTTLQEKQGDQGLASTEDAAVNSRLKNTSSRFYVQCERPYRTRSKLFYEIKELINKFQDETQLNRTMLQGISIYSYSNHRVEGVLIKGDMNGEALGKASNVLIRFVNKCIDLGSKTITNICAELIHDGFDSVLKRAKRGAAIDKQAVLKELLLSYEAHPEYFLPANDPDLSDRKIDLTSSKQAKERGSQFITDAAEGLWNALIHYSEDWWQIIEQARLLYRWVIAGPEKNEQMIAVMMRDYARIESELSDAILASQPLDGIREIEVRSLSHKLKSIRQLNENEALRLQIIDVLTGGNSGEETGKPRLTFALIADMLSSMLKTARKRQGSKLFEEELNRWDMLCKSLKATAADRNALMHGRHLDMFSKDPQKNELWGGFVIRYLLVASLVPHLKRTLLKLQHAS